MFKVEIIGNIGADAEVKESNGSKFVTFRVAHSDKWKTDTGEEKESTIWVDVTLNNTESKVVPYLRQGVKVFVRGNGRMRVYSSPKDRCMKAGLSISALEIELCGGQSDEVPRQLVNPDDGSLIDVTKHFWANIATKGMKKDDTRVLYDVKGNSYVMNAGGFVVPSVPQVDSQQPKEGE